MSDEKKVVTTATPTETTHTKEEKEKAVHEATKPTTPETKS